MADKTVEQTCTYWHFHFCTEVAQWKAERTLSPAKRGRKPGSGKKNIIKTATGKVVFVSIDLSQFSKGTILLQVRKKQARNVVSLCAFLPEWVL